MSAAALTSSNPEVHRGYVGAIGKNGRITPDYAIVRLQPQNLVPEVEGVVIPDGETLGIAGARCRKLAGKLGVMSAVAELRHTDDGVDEIKLNILDDTGENSSMLGHLISEAEMGAEPDRTVILRAGTNRIARAAKRAGFQEVPGTQATFQRFVTATSIEIVPPAPVQR